LHNAGIKSTFGTQFAAYKIVIFERNFSSAMASLKSGSSTRPARLTPAGLTHKQRADRNFAAYDGQNHQANAGIFIFYLGNEFANLGQPPSR
jgi:hypothetical protein